MKRFRCSGSHASSKACLGGQCLIGPDSQVLSKFFWSLLRSLPPAIQRVPSLPSSPHWKNNLDLDSSPRKAPRKSLSSIMSKGLQQTENLKHWARHCRGWL